MRGRTTRRLRTVLTFAIGVGMFVVLAAPLPGEMRGCGGDESGVASLTGYCRDKCDEEAHKLRLCEKIDDTDDAENANYDDCVEARQCVSPNMCMGVPNAFISNGEAGRCFEAIRNLSCGEVSLNDLSNLIEYTETPTQCTAEEICDPL